MAARYHEGASTMVIASEFGVSQTVVQYALREQGVDLKARQQAPSEARLRAVALYTEDTTRSATDVAQMLGVSRQAVIRLLHLSGVKVRSTARIVALKRWSKRTQAAA